MRIEGRNSYRAARSDINGDLGATTRAARPREWAGRRPTAIKVTSVMVPAMTIEEIDQDRFAQMHAGGAPVVDVREPHEYEAGHVPGAVNIPLGELVARAHELADHDHVYAVCGSGGRSLRGAEALARAGVTAINVAGGTKAWRAAGRPTTPGPTP